MGYLFEAIKRLTGERTDASAAGEPSLRFAGDGRSAEPNAEGEGSPTTTVSTRDADDRLVVLAEPASVASEEYRSIRTGLLARSQQRRHLLHTVTSATPQEGKTITALNLALSFAELRNRRTVVVEADLRLPQFARLLHLPGGPGLVQVLDGRAPVAEATVSAGETGLHVIAAGGCADDRAVQLLSNPTMLDVLKQLRQKYDHVIIDTPPVNELADAGILGSLSDDVLLVVRLNRTPRSLVEQAVRTLRTYNAAVAGMIATDQPRSRRRYTYRYDHYQSRRAAQRLAA